MHLKKKIIKNTFPTCFQQAILFFESRVRKDTGYRYDNDIGFLSQLFDGRVTFKNFQNITILFKFNTDYYIGI